MESKDKIIWKVKTREYGKEEQDNMNIEKYREYREIQRIQRNIENIESKDKRIQKVRIRKYENC